MKKPFRAILAMAVLLSLWTATSSFAEQGKVVRVIDGDTFQAEVEGKTGPEVIDVNLRCADAPILGSPFGTEAKQHLEKLLGQAAVFSYKVQAYCGSERCVEALVYFPSETAPDVPYVNTLMIEAGLARNSTCRGVFTTAENNAKEAELGIWSTGSRIVFDEPARAVTSSEPAPAARKTKPITQSVQEAPAIVEFDRAERTVTIKSEKISLTRVVSALDAVSPTPINVYLEQETYISANMEKVPWYEALQKIVETADLKQVNIDGKVDLYTRLFYYKHVAPYLKVAGNVGVYMNAGESARQAPAKDDGTTRYVFINDFENSAEVAQQYREAKKNNESGFIQVHEGDARAPVSSYGTFERSGPASATGPSAATEPVAVQTSPPAAVAKVAPVPEKESIAPAPPKPYSGKQAIPDTDKAPPVVAAAPQKTVEETGATAVKATEPAPKPPAEPAKTAEVKKVEAPQPPVAAVDKKAAEAPAVAVQDPPAQETPAPETPAAKQPAEPAADTRDSGSPGQTVAASSGASPAPAPGTEFTLLHGVALVVIIMVVIAVCIVLMRSAKSGSVRPEQPGDPADQSDAAVDGVVDDAQVDKAYEDEIFDQLEHAADAEATPEDVDSAFGAPPVVKAPESSTPPPVEIGSEDEQAASAADDVIAEEDAAEPEKDEIEKAVDEGNFEVRVQAYNKQIHGPEREQRKVCLFEVKCRVDGQSYTGIGLDISSGGLFVDSREIADIGKVVELEFRLGNDDESIVRCRGAVTWYNKRPDPIKPDYPNGFGVRFVDMDATTRLRIEDYIAGGEDSD